MMYQWDFWQPLITVAAAEGAANTLMQKLQQFLPLSGPSPGAGAPGLPVGNPITAIYGGTISAVGGSVQSAFAPQVPQ